MLNKAVNLTIPHKVNFNEIELGNNLLIIIYLFIIYLIIYSYKDIMYVF